MDGRAFRLRGGKGNALPQYSMHPFSFSLFGEFTARATMEPFFVLAFSGKRALDPNSRRFFR
jgi:hypothetical protein